MQDLNPGSLTPEYLRISHPQGGMWNKDPGSLLCDHFLKNSENSIRNKFYAIVNEGDTEVVNTEILWRLVCLFTDSPGQLGCNCEQGHRFMAQTLWDPGTFSLNLPNNVESAGPALSILFLGHDLLNWLKAGFLLWCSKCNFFSSKII